MNYAKSEYYYNKFIEICEEKTKQENTIIYYGYEDFIYDKITEEIPYCQGYKINNLIMKKI